MVDGLMTSKEVTDYLGVAYTTVTGYVRQGKLNPIRKTKTKREVLLFSSSEVKKFKSESEAMTKGLLTTKEAMEYLDRTKAAMDQYIRRGKLRIAKQKGHKNFFDIKDLEKLKQRLRPYKGPRIYPDEDEVTEYGSTIHWSKKFRKEMPHKGREGIKSLCVSITCGCGNTIEILAHRLRGKKPKVPLCRKCAIEVTKRVGFETYVNPFGYVMVSFYNLSKEEQKLFASMKNPRNGILEHRLVMARHLGRPLTRKESVHHLDGVKTNNLLSNLAVYDVSKHTKLHNEQLKREAGLRKQVGLLKGENARLRQLLRKSGIKY